MSTAANKCALHIPHKDGELTNADLIRNFRKIEEWQRSAFNPSTGCYGRSGARIGVIVFSWPGILSQTNTGIFTATADYNFDTVELVAESHGISGTVSVQLQTGSPGSWTTFATYSLTGTSTDLGAQSIDLDLDAGESMRAKCTAGGETDTVDLSMTIGGGLR